jgi:3-oxoacyl-[acyl-carrier-protein] synthase I
MNSVAMLASGMVNAVGLNSAASCAAIRCAIDNFSETRFIDHGGEWIIGSQVPLEQPWRGLPRLVHLAVPAIRECLAHIGKVKPEEIPLLLCVAEKERPGRLEGLDDELFHLIQTELGVRFDARSGTIAKGRTAGALALDLARKLIHKEKIPLCIVAGTDTFLIGPTLAAYEEKDRLLTSQNSNGFIPGEAAAAVLVGPADFSASPNSLPALLCLGIGRGQETASIDSGEPLKADGLVQAFKAAFADSGTTFNDLHYRITDANGEQYWFKEAALALNRTLRVRKEQFDIWHTADCIGETGAASGPTAFSVVLAASRKKYAPGPGTLSHFGSDNGERMALVFGELNRAAA